MRRTKAAQIYKKTGNLRVVKQLLLHKNLESTVRYLGIEVDDALPISEQVEISLLKLVRSYLCTAASAPSADFGVPAEKRQQQTP